MKQEFEATMLRIHFGESDRWQGKPLHEAIVEKCEELGMTGAIVYRGIEGYGTSTRVRRASSMWKFSRDAPMMVSVVDSAEKIAELTPHLDAMVGEGLVAASAVRVVRYTRAAEEPRTA